MGIIDSLSNKVNSIADNALSSLKSSILPKSTKDTVKNILQTNWDLTDDFVFVIHNTYINTKCKKGECLDNEVLQKSLLSVEIPVLTSQEIDNVLGGTRRINTKMQESFRFNVRFRDFDAGRLKKYFTMMWVAQQYMYFDDIKSTIHIKVNGSTAFYSENCIITQISAQTYDTSSTGISEFEITFMSPSFTDTNIKEFGIDPEYAKEFGEVPKSSDTYEETQEQRNSWTTDL